MTDLYTLSSKTFAGQLHTRFKVQTSNGVPVILELAEVSEPTAPPHIELFCLLFRGPLAPRLFQQIHRLEHEKLGSLDLFLTAIGADETGTNYEVVFNRVRSQPRA